MTKWILIAGGLLAGLSVVVGAFGAHALKDVLDPKAVSWINTGASYQTTHALALIACGLLPRSKTVNTTASLFALGTILFSGSLYLMAMTGITKLGIITPMGGMSLIFGWIFFCIAVYRLRPADKAPI